MPKVKIHNRLIKKHKIRAFTIKAVGNPIKQTKNQRLYKKYNDTVIYDGIRYFLVYEFQEEQDDVITFIREIKRAVKK
jgi:hypothetical protein